MLESRLLRLLVTLFLEQEINRSDSSREAGMTRTRLTRMAKCGKSAFYTRHKFKGSRQTLELSLIFVFFSFSYLSSLSPFSFPVQ